MTGLIVFLALVEFAAIVWVIAVVGTWLEQHGQAGRRRVTRHH